MNIFEVIKEEVSIFQVFDNFDPPVKYQTTGKPSQIHCPFHGSDVHPSARVYPDTNSMYCFVCAKSWDVISAWADHNHLHREDGSLNKFVAAKQLAEMFNIELENYDSGKLMYKHRAQFLEGINKNDLDISERLRVKNFYVFRVGSLVNSLDPEAKVAKSQDILNLWESFALIDFYSDSWRQDLTNWYNSVTILL